MCNDFKGTAIISRLKIHDGGFVLLIWFTISWRKPEMWDFKHLVGGICKSCDYYEYVVNLNIIQTYNVMNLFIKVNCNEVMLKDILCDCLSINTPLSFRVICALIPSNHLLVM